MPIDKTPVREEQKDVDQNRNRTLNDPGAAVPGYGRSAGENAQQDAGHGEKDTREPSPIPLRKDDTIGNP